MERDKKTIEKMIAEKNESQLSNQEKQALRNLLEELENKENIRKKLSSKYIELFVTNMELMDELHPSWRYHAEDSLKKLNDLIKEKK